ncbi:MAG: rhomboid family intramembrane serine protease [Verrucomicrobiae bacterium]|nr:rhomboid family intramembrane serine protease [Verrucomicrobiae bacterium]
MPICPACHEPLRVQRVPEGMYYACGSCTGRSLTLAQVRARGGDPLVNALLRQLNRRQTVGERPCPFCEQKMTVLSPPQAGLELDGCRSCGIIWFDTHELESVPAAPPPSLEELHYRAAEEVAKEKIQQRRELEQEPDAEWKTLPALLGLPVEAETTALRRRPWVTWGLAILISVVSVAAFFNLETVVAQWGMVPSAWWRHGGLTLLTAFFLHGGILHLVGNVYFLLIFGDNVEDELGRGRYLLLLLLATLGGQLLHILFEPHSAVPAIGASGGISGVLAFYALQFPRARISLLARLGWRFYWLKFSALSLFIVWMLLQCWVAYQQIRGFGNVSGTAHLGGALVGILFWWGRRLRQAGKAAPPRPGSA